MLNISPAPDAGAESSSAVWFDLLELTADELQTVEAAIGAPLPTLASLKEIEPSRRLRRQSEALYMSMPTAVRRSPDDMTAAPVGFVLNHDRLVTLRFTALPAFDAVAAAFDAAALGAHPGCTVFADICQQIVGRIADGLEYRAEELNTLSAAAFHSDNPKGRGSIRANRLLRIQLRQVGALGNRLSEVRDVLLGLGRVVSFVDQAMPAEVNHGIKARLASLRADIVALDDYQEHLANKVQFILDAMMGLISIAQNDTFKVLTIVSIVGIPPTLVAGVYGMNFHNMPEYSWSFGYQFGLAAILISAIIPVVWFKIKGWF